ncbi:hypothetical protein ACIQD5_29790 [Streptomyces microflavus]|uniref:hypothetical protein n=1 Tax=Streptomyces microflavus TaxID=1919 RepID=UPI00381B11C6
MNPVQILSLLLAISVALNIGCAAGLIATQSGVSRAGSVLAGGSAAASALALYLTGVSAYH